MEIQAANRKKIRNWQLFLPQRKKKYPGVRQEENGRWWVISMNKHQHCNVNPLHKCHTLKPELAIITWVIYIAYRLPVRIAATLRQVQHTPASPHDAYPDLLGYSEFKWGLKKNPWLSTERRPHYVLVSLPLVPCTSEDNNSVPVVCGAPVGGVRNNEYKD